MKFTIFLSTDGKHTVQAEGEAGELGEMRVMAEASYDAILQKYGTKQEQTVKAYNPKPAFPDDSGPQAIAPEPAPQTLGVCPKCGAPNWLSKSGKIYCSKKCWL